MSRLAWFSPLPPAASEIANVTARLAPDLQARHETRFFTEVATGFQEPAAGTDYPAPLGEVSSALWPTLNALDVPVYNLGNHPGFFAHTWFLSQRKPGIILLHDLKLHDLFVGIYRERLGDPAGYLERLRKDYGPLGYEAGIAFWQRELPIALMTEQFPMTAWAIEGALGVIVHTEHALNLVRTLTNAPVVLAPLPLHGRPAPAVLSPPRLAEPFTPDHPARLVIFGFLNVNRRVVEFLTVLAGMPERESFAAEIYGEIAPGNPVAKTVGALGLAGQVALHGFVPDDALSAALDRADLAVNLRYPSMGEASASQLRLWDHALPSLVTRTDGYSDLPPDAVFFVRPEQEAEDIQGHLRRLLREPEVFRAAGWAGQRFVREKHRPSQYLDQLDTLVAALPDLRSRRNQLEAATRFGTRSAPWLDATPRTAREWHYAETIARMV